MKFLKGLFIGLASLLALLLIIALFIKKDYGVEREVTINKPKQEVFEYIKFLKNQDQFSVWGIMDPNMKKEYKGTDGTVGFVSTWDSEVREVGKGEQEIKKITEGERMDFELRIKKPFESTDNAYMSTEAISETQTKVKWGFSGRKNYPMNLILVLKDLDKMLGDQLQTGLNNLKMVIEK